jgi:hypothetical protein
MEEKEISHAKELSLKTNWGEACYKKKNKKKNYRELHD